MRKFGLIGYPLGHSFSQKYFSDKFIKENISDCIYMNYPISDLAQFQELISEETDLCGLNVTIPYKSDIIKYIDVLDPEVEEIGAVNVVKIKRKQNRFELYGFNSDVTGIRDSLLPHLKKDVKNAIVLGSGGSSRSVCYVLKKYGLNINLISRYKKPGILTYSDISAKMISDTDIIINTTPLGMFPNIDTKPDLAYNLLSDKHILFDLVYNPEFTSFLKMGIGQGCSVISGIKMLHSQAERSWEIWNDINL